jgi:glycosyltransferase 2 family protein
VHVLNRQRLTIIVGIVVALVAAYFAVKDINAQELLTALSSAHYIYVAPALGVTFLGYFARAWRWQLMIAPVKHISLRTVFPLLVIGFAWNFAIPLRIGELVRAHLLGQREGISRSMLFATVVVERVLDGVAIMALLALVGWLSPGLPAWVEDFTRIALLLFGIALGGLVMLIVSEKFTLRILAAITLRLPHAIGARIYHLAVSFVQGYLALRSPRSLLTIVVATFVGWFIEIASYAILFPAFNLQFDLPTFISASSFYAVVLNLTTLIPSSPGFVGTTQYFGRLALNVFSVAAANALSLTVIAHAIQLTVILSLGAWAVWHEGLTVKRLEQVTAQVE